MGKTKQKRPILSVTDATKGLASAEQRHERARSALAAAADEAEGAEKALNAARRALRDANRKEIEKAKGES